MALKDGAGYEILWLNIDRKTLYSIDSW